jgi:hypothetical protein
MVDLDAQETKLAELMLYVAKRILTDPAGGATKLNKILYFAEFARVRAAGVPITGVPYQKLARGPAPRRLRPIREHLVAERAADMRTDEYFGRDVHRLVPLRDADLSLFTDDEIRTVDQVIDALGGTNGRNVSDRSHEDMAWQLVEEGDEIPYAAAFLVNKPTVTPTSRRHARQLADRRGIPR